MKLLTRFYPAPLKPFSSKLTREKKWFQRIKPAFTQIMKLQKHLHANLLRFLLIPLDKEDDLEKLCQNPSTLLRQRGKE